MILSFHEDMQGTIPSSTMAHPRTHSQTNGVKSDVRWLQLYPASSFPGCCQTPLISQTTRFIFRQELVQKALIREMFFADDAAVTAPTGEALRRLIYCLVIT